MKFVIDVLYYYTLCGIGFACAEAWRDRKTLKRYPFWANAGSFVMLIWFWLPIFVGRLFIW